MNESNLWIDIISKFYTNLHNTDRVLKASDLSDNRRERLFKYFERLEELHKKVANSESKTGEKLLKSFYYDLYVIKPEDIPESYFQKQISIARERGYGNIKLTPENRKQMIDQIIEDQKESLDKWIELRNICHELEKDRYVDGIVITHGTDTLEETAFFLNLTLACHKPVVLTGSMRPATATSADGPMNLYQAVALACHMEAWQAGVLAVISDTIYSGRDLQKTNSYKTDAFKMGEFGSLGYMRDDHVYLLNAPFKKHTFQTIFSKMEFEDLPKVEIFYVHTDSDPELLKFMLDTYDGLVLAGTGSGNYPTKIKEVLENYTGECTVVRASRVLEGAVFDSEVFDSKRVTIPAYKFSAQKARILLMLALSCTKNHETIKSFFQEY